MSSHLFSTIRTVAALGTLLSLALRTDAADGAPGHQPLSYLGYWHDGSGVIPGCRVVDTWNETDFTGNGKHQEPAGPNHVNLVYKVPHYNWCNGGLVVAGGRLFAMSDRGGFGFYADRAADFAGAELFCYDPATGEELWRTDLDHWDLVPGGAELRRTVLEYNRLEAKIYGAYAPMGSAMRNRNKVPMTSERYLELAEPLRELIPDLPATLADIKGHIIDSKGYEQIHFYKKVAKKYFPEMLEMRKRILQAGYLMDPWGGKWDPLGISMQTPVSDGEHIYVSTAYGAVFCVDFDGEVVWKRWYGGGMDRAPAIPSPILVGNLLVVTTHPPDAGKPNRDAVRMGIDKRTGETVWTVPHKGGYQPGPTALRLHVGGDAARPMDVLFYPGDGVVLRAADGRELASQLPANGSGRPAIVSGTIIVNKNKNADGGSYKVDNPFAKGACAFRLSAPGEDRVEAEKLWEGKDLSWSGMVAYGDVLFHIERDRVESYNLVTGEQIASTGNPGGKSRHYIQLVGDKLISLDDHGFSTVAHVTPAGQIGKVVANRLGTLDYGKHQPSPMDKTFNYGAQFTASGNRIWTRSNTHLYCIGNPKEPTRLSPQHAGAGGATGGGTAARNEAEQEDEEPEPAEAETDAGAAVDREKIATALSKHIAAGKSLSFRMASTGMEVTATALADGTLTIESDGMSMEFPLDRISAEDLTAIATALAE